MKHTAGRWDRTANNVYFIASSLEILKHGGKSQSHLLCAVNEIKGDNDIEGLQALCAAGKTVFIDSGVFNLANSHAVANDMTMDQALSLPPTALDGFDALLEKYTDIMRRIGDDVWGYIEIDQGGRDNKRVTRAKLEAMGLRPIPVYHPLVDGWEYFDELAEQYDRICFGNVVQADQATRKRLLATAWERRRKYPHLWIHLLGLTVNEKCNAYPVDSCDSSTWLNLVRWPDSFKAKAAGQSFGSLTRNITYAQGSDADSTTGHQKAWQLGGYDSYINSRNWRAVLADYGQRLAVDVNGYTAAPPAPPAAPAKAKRKR